MKKMILLLTSLLTFTIILTGCSKTNYLEDDFDFINTKGGEWEDNIFVPYVDICTFPVLTEYNNGGILNIPKIMYETGVSHFNLGFIVATDDKVSNGILNWSIQGVGEYKEGGSNAAYPYLLEMMDDIRNKGGDFTFSFGGATTKNLFQYTDDLDVLVNTYLYIIYGYNLTRIDLDIEGNASNTCEGYEYNKLNAEAIKIVQDLTGVEVVLTLPASHAYGLTPEGFQNRDNVGYGTLRAYLEAGVKIEMINIMAMYFGVECEDYAIGVVDAMDKTMLQIIEQYKNIGVTLTKEEAYGLLGVTTSVGYGNSNHPIFTVDDSKVAIAHAIDKNIHSISIWNINRDSKTQENSGIYNQYEHTTEYLKFENNYK